jgi:ferredoxin
MKALVLYYSGSGNTKYLAESAHKALTSKRWDAEICHLRDFNKNTYPYNPDLIILGVPVHYWDIPNSAKELIRKIPEYSGTSAFVFSTFGKCVCNSVPFFLAKELIEKGCNILGGGQIVSPHAAKVDGNERLGDSEIEFGKGQPDDATLDKFISVVRVIAEKVETNNTVQIELEELKKLHTRGVVASFMNNFTSNRERMWFLPHIEHIRTKCDSCNKCIKSCDAHAIKYTSSKEIVINKKRCNKCYKCTDVCSSGALTTNWNKVIFLARAVHLFAREPSTKFVA